MNYPEPGQPIIATIEYMGKLTTVVGCRSLKDPDVVMFDFYSGTGYGTIIDWEPRDLPKASDPHPWTGIENRGIG